MLAVSQLHKHDPFKDDLASTHVLLHRLSMLVLKPVIIISAVFIFSFI